MAFEPHLHAPGVRMCLEAIFGHNKFTINCVGYDHNWVKQYIYKEDSAPLLPKGTILQTIAYMDTSSNNLIWLIPETGLEVADVPCLTCS